MGKTGWKLGIGILYWCHASFTLLENMKIWGNIQVIIYPFLAICLKFLFKIAVMFQFRPRLNNLLAFQLQVSCSKLYNSRKSRTSTSAKSEREAVHIFHFTIRFKLVRYFSIMDLKPINNHWIRTKFAILKNHEQHRITDNFLRIIK